MNRPSFDLVFFEGDRKTAGSTFSPSESLKMAGESRERFLLPEDRVDGVVTLLRGDFMFVAGPDEMAT